MNHLISITSFEKRNVFFYSYVMEIIQYKRSLFTEKGLASVKNILQTRLSFNSNIIILITISFKREQVLWFTITTEKSVLWGVLKQN